MGDVVRPVRVRNKQLVALQHAVSLLNDGLPTAKKRPASYAFAQYLTG